jgi:hypothetical protein
MTENERWQDVVAAKVGVNRAAFSLALLSCARGAAPALRITRASRASRLRLRRLLRNRLAAWRQLAAKSAARQKNHGNGSVNIGSGIVSKSVAMKETNQQSMA